MGDGNFWKKIWTTHYQNSGEALITILEPGRHKIETRLKPERKQIKQLVISGELIKLRAAMISIPECQYDGWNGRKSLGKFEIETKRKTRLLFGSEITVYKSFEFW